MAQLLRGALVLACCGLSACAAVERVRGTSRPNEVASAKSAEALQSCVVARLQERRPEGLPAPVVAPARTVNGYTIGFPPLAHAGVMVVRHENGASTATWQATEAQYLGPIGDAVRGCAAG